MGNTSLVSSGMFLAVVGAILKWGVADRISGVDLGLIGVILLIAGAVMAVLGLIPRRSTHVVTDSRDGRVVEERRDDIV